MRNAGVVILKKRRAGVVRPRLHSAWKVAYADFITALMAVFLVLWLGNQETAVRVGVANYFRDPGIFNYVSTTGTEVPPVTQRAAAAPAPLDAVAQRIRDALAAISAAPSAGHHVVINGSERELVIELVDSANAVFFATGSAVPSPAAERALMTIGGELARADGTVAIAGHTDARPYQLADRYGNWELSADRANAARRILERAGLPAERIRGVHGFADTELREPERPLDARNRRVAIVVKARS